MPEMQQQVLHHKFYQAQLLGWPFPNCLTLKVYAEVENSNLCINIERMQNCRDYLYDSFRKDGWNTSKPEGGFYMLVQVPRDLFVDEQDMLDELLEEGILVLPGSIMAIERWTRLSLTASDEMAHFAIKSFCKVHSKCSTDKSVMS